MDIGGVVVVKTEKRAMQLRNVLFETAFSRYSPTLDHPFLCRGLSARLASWAREQTALVEQFLWL